VEQSYFLTQGVESASIIPINVQNVDDILLYILYYDDTTNSATKIRFSQNITVMRIIRRRY